MPSYIHKPVMLEEVLAALRPATGRRYVDGTVGGAGHASAILRASAPDGWLFGCDRDGAAIEAAAERLAEFGDRVELKRGSYRLVGEWVAAESCDGVLLDLGVSSPQLDWAERGFSFQQEGPLDMRMNRESGMTAGEWLNTTGVEEMAKTFFELGEEPRARRVARAIAAARERSPLKTTTELAAVVEAGVGGRRGKTHPATRVFQAVRMAVNDELGELREGLPAVWGVMRSGGRLAVITFHSGEDRLVKAFGRGLEKDYEVEGSVDVPELRRPRPAQARWVQRKAMAPGEAEIRENPRARSAQLRVLEKL